MTADDVVKQISAILDSQKVEETLEDQVTRILARSNRLDAWRAYKAMALPDDPVIANIDAAFAEDTLAKTKPVK